MVIIVLKMVFFPIDLTRASVRSLYYIPFFCRKYYHNIPYFDLYRKVTGHELPLEFLPRLRKKHPNIDTLSSDRLKITIQIIAKYGITPLDACRNPHIFVMNPITMDNYGEILRECGFTKILPEYIIRYHTLVRSRTITTLKKEGLLPRNLVLEQKLLECFHNWPHNRLIKAKKDDEQSSILSIRMKVLEAFLKWRLNICSEDFVKYCRNYLPLKHKPMSDIEEAIDYAQNEIKISTEVIKRNGFIISSDPVNTKMIIENVDQLGGLDIREAIRLEPAILKNNYEALLKIREIMEEFRIPEVAQKSYLRIFCMCPETVRQRLNELTQLKEYQVLSSNHRVLWMVVHKTKMMERLQKIQKTSKQCYSLNHLVTSNKIFNSYINSFGNKACSRDMAILICHSLGLMNHSNLSQEVDTSQTKEQSLNPRSRLKVNDPEIIISLRNQLKRHNYWLHVPLNVIHENINLLKKNFCSDIIFSNCHILLYPVSEIQYYLEQLLQMRDCSGTADTYTMKQTDPSFANLDYGSVTDDQVLSLVLYYIEKKHHFTGDGIWGRNEPQKITSQVAI